MATCVAIKKGGVPCTYKAKFGQYCGFHKHLSTNPPVEPKPNPEAAPAEPKANPDPKPNPEVPNVPEVVPAQGLINRGTGAGGSRTNLCGKKFEETTDQESNLLTLGFVKKTLTRSKFGYYLQGQIDNVKIIFVKQNGLKVYMQKIHNIECIRCPDEAYIIQHGDDTYHVVIIEKKEQNVEGSVETKLWSGPALKREYELVLGDKFTVSYCFTLNHFFKEKFASSEKKYTILKQILTESQIPIFYGDDDDYNEILRQFVQKHINTTKT